MPTDLQATLDELTAYPSTEHPFLSIYLNWKPDGNGNRKSIQVLEQELDALAQGVKNRDGNLESFDADRAKIMEYVNRDAPKDALGLAIFACNAEGVWITQPLKVEIENDISEDRYPHTFHLARLVDDYETYAVVMADSQESRIFVISMNEAERAGGSEAAEEIRRFEAGGWGQMLFQRRIENVIKAHTKDMADQLGRIIKRHSVQHVILAGNDSIKGVVRSSLPQQTQDMVVDFVNIDMTANMQQILEIIEPMMREVERAQEADDVAKLQEQINTKGGLGFVGIADTALALSKGQVRKLLMVQGFNGMGGECPNCGILRPGMRPTCPFDGAEMQQVNLREIFVARATQQGGDVQIIEADEFLDQHEGIGALLWYRDDVESTHEQTRTA